MGFTEVAKIPPPKQYAREELANASKHPGVVQQLGSQYTTWSKTLAPLGEIPEIRAAEPIIPSGHGWAFAPAKDKGPIAK